MNKSIRTKLTTLLIAAAMVPLIVIIIVGLGEARKLLNDKDFNHLEAIGTLKRNAVHQYFENAVRDVNNLSYEQNTANVVAQISEAIGGNGMILDGKINLNSTALQNIYSANNAFFKGFISAYNFNELYLISAETGHVIYTVSKQNGLGSNILSAELKNNSLSKLYTNVLKSKETQITDFSIEPVSGKIKAYIGSPVLNNSGNTIAVVVVELNTTEVAEILHETTGLGKTGETYLVGSDYLMRTNSRFITESSILKNKVETESVSLGIQKTEGKHVIKSYRDKTVLSYFVPLELDKKFNTDFDWVLVAEINESEAFLAFKGLVIQMMVIAAIMFILIFIIATVFSKLFTKPILQLKEITRRIANGDLTQSTFIKQGDEIGELAESVKIMRENLRTQLEEMLEGANVLSTSSAQMMTMISQLAAGSAETATSVSETTATVEEVKQTVEVSNQKAVEVADSAQQMSMVSQEGKSSVNETINGMNKIKQQMESIAGIVIQLSDKGNTIGEIATNVNDLAEQSNLLAVNASIEAAKAGEHGKGFAVVAQEIKNLAERSKMATVQIRTILSDIQKEISSAVLATENGTKAIDAGLIQSSNASEVIAVLASGVEETAQSNIQIAASSQQLLVGTDQIAMAMENIKEASVQTASSIKQSEDSVADLKNLGERLLGMFKKYKLK